MAEGRIVGRASKPPNPTPLSQGLDPPVVSQQLIIYVYSFQNK